MKRINILILSLTLLIAACSGGSNFVIDKAKKAIVSRSGDPFKKVVITGAGKSVTFENSGAPGDNSIIYFYRVNPGFMVSEGFGLNSNYILKLEPGKKYTVYIYSNPKDETAFPLYFKTDYNNNIIDDPDKD